MATIEQRTLSDGTTSYRVKIRLRGRPPATATFKRKTDARRWIQDTESAIRNGRYFNLAEAKRHTLAEALDRYIRDVLPSKGRSRKDQHRQLLWWREQIGDYVLADVTPAVIAERRDVLANGVTARGAPRSPATVNRYLAAISHVFTVAVNEWEWLETSPMSKVRRPREPRGRVRFLSDEERQRLLQVCEQSKSSSLYAVVVLALSTGARAGEILGLRWPDVDMARQVIRFEKTKNDQPRAVPLTGHALAVLRDRSKVRRLDSDLVFPSVKDGSKPIDLRDAWVKALRDAEIEGFRFHDLRHSTASYLAMNGASLAEIAEVLGHRTLQMVKRYSHLTEAHTHRVVSSMNEKIFGSSG